MSEDSSSQKDSWFSIAREVLTRTPTFIFLLGIALIVLAASDGWQEQIRIADAYWKNAVFFLGVVVLGFGGTLVWRGLAAEQAASSSKRQAKSYGVTVTTPHETLETSVKNPGQKAYFEAAGEVKALPADAQIWVFIVVDGMRWPYGPASITGKLWTVDDVRPGKGARKNMEVYVVGKDGQALIREYRRAREEIWKEGERIKKLYPRDDIEIRTPPMREVTTDMVRCAERTVKLANNG